MQTPVLQPWFKQLQQTYPTVTAAKNAPFTSELLNNQVKQYDPELRTKLLEIPAVERRKVGNNSNSIQFLHSWRNLFGKHT